MPHKVELGVHTMFVGGIKDAKANESALTEGGAPDLEKMKLFVFSYGSRSFYSTGGARERIPELAGEYKR